jgi:hypothetical protein
MLIRGRREGLTANNASAVCNIVRHLVQERAMPQTPETLEVIASTYADGACLAT